MDIEQVAAAADDFVVLLFDDYTTEIIQAKVNMAGCMCGTIGALLHTAFAFAALQEDL